MTGLRIVPVGDDALLERWRHVHNTVVPPAAMSWRTRGSGGSVIGCGTPFSGMRSWVRR
ncbi:hypothetical protein [Streptomyces broussonetiae]|uniref:hypothetical protein n=1 Tax=Streptomyces broussonetiae TaxID=2686304 RepID=UPI002D7F223F|nr:hypothetical protein [Streptomyces broussonetiae]